MFKRILWLSAFLALSAFAGQVLIKSGVLHGEDTAIVGESTWDKLANASSQTTQELWNSTKSFLKSASFLLPDAVIQSLSSELPAHDATVGITPGQASVSGGSASYSIPIALPPGRKGMQPDISINYSSKGGNGIAGLGWNVSGFSSLHRCPMTVEQDAQARAVDYSMNDRLCFDGQRLVATSGTYGALNTTYSTEIDSFARITQLGGDLNAINSYFKVEYKSGEIAYFGGSTTALNNARVIAGGLTKPLNWLIARSEDRLGNNMVYTYTNFGNGEVQPTAIYYTGFTTTQGDRKVEFVYTARPATSLVNDISSSYLSNGLSLQTQRLTNIKTWIGTEAVRDYQLRYDAVSTVSGRSLLRGVKECALSSGGSIITCRPETTFAWQDTPAGHSFKPLSLAFPGLPDQSTLYDIQPAADLDGDGNKELAVSYKPIDGTPISSYLISFDADHNLRNAIAFNGIQGFEASGAYKQYVDFNHDGRDDLLSATVVNSVAQYSVGVWNNSTTQWLESGFTQYPLGVPYSNCPAQPTDYNSDGLTDLLVIYPETPSGFCDRGNMRLKIYLGIATAVIGQPAVNTNASIDIALPFGSNIIDGSNLPITKPAFIIERTDDFNGDGLPDVFLTRKTDRSERNKPQLVWLGRVNSSGLYTLGGTGNEITSFAALASPALGLDETHVSSFNQWIDVNGDGLTDLVGAQRQTDGFGYWSVRLNKGGILGARIVTTNRRGLEICVPTTTAYLSATCVERWRPMFLPRFDVADTNSDGRVEMLVPRAFAARICHVQNYKTTAGETRSKYYCAENPITGEIGPIPYGLVAPEDRLVPVYGQTGSSTVQGEFDSSSYFMDSVSFAQINASSFRAVVNSTQIIKGGVTRSLDLYSDGIEDQISFMGYAFKPKRLADGTLNHGYAFVGTGDPATWGPSTLPDGTPVTDLVDKRKLFVSENNGAGIRLNQPALMPDKLAVVTNSFGLTAQFDYYPMSSKAGRISGTPLYSVPSDIASRYIDDRHIYFNTPLQVVSEMKQSNGLGSNTNTTRYSYSEAMYNTQGRGFQGFRKIIEENVSSGLRTTTTFHQKYPLTSRVEKTTTTLVSQPEATAALLNYTVYLWRCNRANRADTSACGPNAAGTNPIRFPFLDWKETVTFNLAAATSPAPSSQPYHIQVEIAADSTNCDRTISSASGYDAYGNLTAQTFLAADFGANGPNLRNYVDLICKRTRNTFDAADTTNWWLDKLTQTQQTNSIVHGVDQTLPAGISNPQQTTTTAYIWNTNRTLASETFQNGIANQQKLTAYTYPVTNYGLPLSVTVTASGDQNTGGRTTSTTYSPDGYFPLSVTNALGHTATTAVRLRDGLPISVTDPNSLRTLTTYDAFSQATLVKARGVLDSQYLAPDKQVAATWCVVTNTINSCGLSDAAYQLTSVQDGRPTTVSTHDKLGRVLRTQSKLLDGTNSYSDTQYNNKGQTIAQSLPYRNGDTPLWNYFVSYDQLGRLTAKSTPQQHAVRGDMVTTYIYNGDTTTIQVCGSLDSNISNCLNLSRSVDVLGRYTETKDALGGITKFWYDANGQALVLQDVKGNQIKATYNAIGQRTSVNDPNQSISNFTYNALGEVLTQTDARSITSTTTYDKLGRKTQFSVTADANGDGTNDAIVDTWSYDPAGAKGQLAQSQRMINGVLERQESSSFDALIRPSAVAAIQNTGSATTRNYSSEFQYDTYYGRVLAQFFPNGEGEQFIFNQYGYETQQRNAVNASIYRQIVTVDAAGRPTKELKGFNLSTDTAYWPNGQTKSIIHQKDGITIRRINYAYDVFGNVATQELNNGMAGNTLESFSYDNLHRLTQSLRTGAASTTVNYGYDAAGNFNFKSDFSLATGTPYNLSTGGLGGGGTNAVKSVSLKAGGTRSYGYDASGNMTSDNAGFAAKYDHANLATKLQRGAVINYFIYGPNNAKARQTGSDGSKVYLGDYEDWITASQTKVSLGNYAQVTNGTGGRVLHYFLTDRLGSVDAVTDGNGNLIETRGYDAFGAPRTGVWGDATQIASTAITPKGFTSHEHLNSVQLIHMNGRMYDYQLGRFLGVDPFIQMPTNSQSLNPYSYIMNNPLSGTDPTGYTSNQSGTASNCAGTSAGCKGGQVLNQTTHTGTHIAGHVPAGLVISGSVSLKDSSSSQSWTVNNTPGQSSSVVTHGYSANGAVPPTEKGKGSVNDEASEILNDGNRQRTQNGIGAAKTIADTIEKLASPCTEGSSAGRCGGEVVLQAAAGGLIGKVLTTEVKLFKLGKSNYGDSAAEYVYRGVHKGHPAEVPARDGIVVPGNPGGTVTAAEHNAGFRSADSPMTSWSRDEATARRFAGEDGVVLRLETGASTNPEWSWETSPDNFEEDELLLRGIREDAEVLGD